MRDATGSGNSGGDHNRRIYETRYTGANYAPRNGDDVFARLRTAKLDLLLKLAPAGARVLDLGCGAGDYLLPLTAAGANVVGLDFSGPILDELRTKAAAEGIDAASLRLHRADARNVPEPDASFDVVFSFATLYTVPEAERAFAESARLLLQGGAAVLDLGMARSLNELEARRVPTGVRSYNRRFAPALKRLADLGLAVEEDRAFQLFPCWGGGTPRATQVLNPLLARRFGVLLDDGRALDEAIASSPLVKPFAFRRLVTLRRTTPAAARLRLADFLESERREADAARGRPDRNVDRRATAALARERGFVAEAASLYVAALAADAGDLRSARALADLYDGVEEQGALSHWDRLGERSAALRESKRASTSRATKNVAPRVSVVLPTYDHARLLPSAVQSVLAQTFDDFELIIVDDGSTDGTADYLATLSDPRVRVISQANRRLPAALNRGFSEARGEYRTWTSADNLAAPSWLAEMVGALDQSPEAGLAVGAFAWIDSEDRILRVTRDQDVSYRSFLTMNPGNAAFLYRSSAAEKIGAYDASLEGAEDWDYWVRLLEVATATRVDAVLYYYRTHGNSLTATIPAKIAEASREVVRRALARAGDTIPFERMYPEIARSEDREAAEVEAAFDCGVRFLKSPWCDPDVAALCFERVFAHRPDSGLAAANWALAAARAGDFAQALELCDRLEGGPHAGANLIVERVRLAAVDGATRLVQHLPPLASDPTSGVLFGAGSTEPAAAPARRTAAPNGGPVIRPTFVVITAGERRKSLETVVRSAFAQCAPGAEVIVVGAGGAPDGARFIAAEEDARAGRLGAMRNKGVQAARGSHIVMLDDDVVLAPDWFERMRAAAAEHPGFDLMTSQVRTPDGSRFWDHATIGGPRGHVILEADESDATLYPTGGGGWIAAKRVFDAVSYDSLRGFYASEDVDFAERVRAAGFVIRHAHDCVAWHADPVYTNVGRKIVRRAGGASVGQVLKPYATADAKTLYEAATTELGANRLAEALDLLRFGAAKFPGEQAFTRKLDGLEDAAGGRLSDARWFAGRDPAFARVLAACAGARPAPSILVAASPPGAAAEAEAAP